MQQGNSARPAGSLPFGSPFDGTPAQSGNATGAAALLRRLKPHDSTGVSRQPLSPKCSAAEGRTGLLLGQQRRHAPGSLPHLLRNSPVMISPHGVGMVQVRSCRCRLQAMRALQEAS